MKRLLILFLLTIPLRAQYVQGGGVNVSPDTIYSVTGSWAEGGPTYSYKFKAQLTAPCTLMVSVRQPGLIITDSQGNPFIRATDPATSIGYTNLWYSSTCNSGADTVTLTCPTPLCWAQFTVGEYAGVWVPDQQSPEIYQVFSATGWTAPITPTQDGELIIGIGSNHTTNTPAITPDPGWTLRANANEFIIDMVQAKAAPIYSEVTYSAPNIWCQTTISFKPAVPPPPKPFVYVIPGFGTFTFSMIAPPDCSDGLCSIVACDETNLCVMLTPGQTGFLAIRKPTGDTTVVSVSP